MAVKRPERHAHSPFHLLAQVPTEIEISKDLKGDGRRSREERDAALAHQNHNTDNKADPLALHLKEILANRVPNHQSYDDEGNLEAAEDECQRQVKKEQRQRKAEEEELQRKAQNKYQRKADERKQKWSNASQEDVLDLLDGPILDGIEVPTRKQQQDFITFIKPKDYFWKITWNRGRKLTDRSGEFTGQNRIQCPLKDVACVSLLIRAFWKAHLENTSLYSG